MPYSEAVRPTRLQCLLVEADSQSPHKPHSAISPRFAISTEVRDLVAGAMVELQRVPLLVASSWRERYVDFRKARIFTEDLYYGAKKNGIRNYRSTLLAALRLQVWASLGDVKPPGAAGRYVNLRGSRALCLLMPY